MNEIEFQVAVNEPYMNLPTWVIKHCPAGVWTTIIRQEDFSKVNDDTANGLAYLCLRAIKAYAKDKLFECHHMFRLAYAPDIYDFSFDGYQFSAIKTKSYVNGDLIDVLQVATTFKTVEAQGERFMNEIEELKTQLLENLNITRIVEIKPNSQLLVVCKVNSEQTLPREELQRIAYQIEEALRAILDSQNLKVIVELI